MTRSQSRTSGKTWLVQVVYIPEPDVTSPAALALLAKKYYSLDKSIYSEFRMHRIRNKWLKLKMKTPDEKGGLTCNICGRKGLKLKNDGRNTATLDHIKEISLGGAWNDWNNFQVACKSCNAKKNILLQRKLLDSCDQFAIMSHDNT